MKVNWITRGKFLHPWTPAFSKNKNIEIDIGKETVPSIKGSGQTESIHVVEYAYIRIFNPDRCLVKVDQRPQN